MRPGTRWSRDHNFDLHIDWLPWCKNANWGWGFLQKDNVSSVLKGEGGGMNLNNTPLRSLTASVVGPSPSCRTTNYEIMSWQTSPQPISFPTPCQHLLHHMTQVCHNYAEPTHLGPLLLLPPTFAHISLLCLTSLLLSQQIVFIHGVHVGHSNPPCNWPSFTNTLWKNAICWKAFF